MVPHWPKPDDFYFVNIQESKLINDLSYQPMWNFLSIFLYVYTQGWQFCPAPLDPPLPASPRAGFPRPAKVMGRGWGEILDPHHVAGRGWVYTF